MKKEQIIIFAGGRIPEKSTEGLDRKKALIIGVDRGAGILFEKGIISDVMIGDFDSVSKEHLKKLKESVPQVMEYSPDKEKTDLELAVSYAMKLRPKELIVWGGSGTRLDHMLSTLHILEHYYRVETDIIFRDEHNEAILVGGRRTILKGSEYIYASIVPVTDEINVSLTGFLYDVQALPVTRGSSRSVSNQIIAESAVLELHAGLAWFIQSKD